MARALRSVAVAAAVTLAACGSALAAEPADWAENLRLTVFGGPAVGLVEITLNGEFVAEFDTDPAVVTDVSDLIRQGENEVQIKLTAAEPAAGARDTTITIGPVNEVGRSRMQMGRPLAEIELPGQVPAGFECTEAIRFWAGPVSEPIPLKERYWLVVDGPPARHRVAVKVNGHTVFDIAGGTFFFDITEHVVKGKNTVEYIARRTCFELPTGRTGNLEIFVATGTENVDIVEMTSEPMALFSLNPESKKEEVSRELSFRGR